LAMLWSGRHADMLSAAASLPRGQTLPAFTGSQLAWALMKLGRNEEAQRTLEEFSSLDPSDTGGFLSALQAWMLAEAGDETGAAEKIEAALRKKHFSTSTTRHSSSPVRTRRCGDLPEPLSGPAIQPKTDSPAIRYSRMKLAWIRCAATLLSPGLWPS